MATKVLRMLLRTIHSSLLTLIAALIILQSSEAMAAYRFNVKVENDTGQIVTLKSIKFKAKGNPVWKNCLSDKDVRIDAYAGSSTIKPYCTADAQKWQRQLRVTVVCFSSGARRELYFPSGSTKFFARDHAQKNRDKYVAKLKLGDC